MLPGPDKHSRPHSPKTKVIFEVFTATCYSRPLSPPPISHRKLFSYMACSELFSGGHCHLATLQLVSSPPPSSPLTQPGLPPLRLLPSTEPRNAITVVHSRVHKTTYAPMIDTALCVMFLMPADTLRMEVGGWGWRWKSRVFWAPKRTRLSARAISLGPTKLETSSANPTPHFHT